MLEYAIYEEMFEFALQVQELIKLGYEFVRVDCSHKYIGPTLYIKKGDRIYNVYDPGEITRIIKQEKGVE